MQATNDFFSNTTIPELRGHQKVIEEQMTRLANERDEARKEAGELRKQVEAAAKGGESQRLAQELQA